MKTQDIHHQVAPQEILLGDTKNTKSHQVKNLIFLEQLGALVVRLL